MEENLLYYGDNLDVLRRYVKDESVDLVYLDPPFNSDQDYNVLFAEKDGVRSTAQIKAFADTWRWDSATAAAYESVVEAGGRVAKALIAFQGFFGSTDLLAYLTMMAPRLAELRRAMKPSASLYLHCDPTASHALKTLLDAVFGPEQFRAEIVWKRHNARSTTRRWPRIHDVLLMYSKTDRYVFHPLKVPAEVARTPHTLVLGPDGLRYQTFELTGPGITREGDSGKPWRGFDPATLGRHWANSEATREEWDRARLIHWPKQGGWPRRLDADPFVPEARTITVGDVWTDIDRINQTAKERLGYPTQKPEALLERIIQASSAEGDVVLDPFCGCGTAVAVAERLKRRWIGIDITYVAVTLVKHRLRATFQDKARFTVVGEPVSFPDARALAAQDRMQFQYWALGLVGARPAEQKKGADKGIDGRIYFHDEANVPSKQIVLSVKSGKVGVRDVRDLRGVIERENAQIGVLITLRAPTREMIREAADAGFYKSQGDRRYAKLQILTIARLLEGERIDGPYSRGVNVSLKSAPKIKPKPPENGRLPL